MAFNSGDQDITEEGKTRMSTVITMERMAIHFGEEIVVVKIWPAMEDDDRPSLADVANK
jgi:hypothetical protein